MICLVAGALAPIDVGGALAQTGSFIAPPRTIADITAILDHRALLVTNWSVHSASARQLVTDLFRRQVIDPKLTRGEALRQAMMALADGEGFTDDSGRTLFAYAHLLFWAPYSIIGDGGGQEGM